MGLLTTYNANNKIIINDKNSATMHAFQKLDKALGKLAKVREAERLKKQQEQRENKKAQDIDACAQALKNIEQKMKNLGV